MHGAGLMNMPDLSTDDLRIVSSKEAASGEKFKFFVSAVLSTISDWRKSSITPTDLTIMFRQINLDTLGQVVVAPAPVPAVPSPSLVEKADSSSAVVVASGGSTGDNVDDGAGDKDNGTPKETGGDKKTSVCVLKSNFDSHLFKFSCDAAKYKVASGNYMTFMRELQYAVDMHGSTQMATGVTIHRSDPGACYPAVFSATLSDDFRLPIFGSIAVGAKPSCSSSDSLAQNIAEWMGTALWITPCKWKYCLAFLIPLTDDEDEATVKFVTDEKMAGKHKCQLPVLVPVNANGEKTILCRARTDMDVDSSSKKHSKAVATAQTDFLKELVTANLLAAEELHEKKIDAGAGADQKQKAKKTKAKSDLKHLFS